jgi:pyruvate dehydrogenase E2 component (dihydrolipoamide acetyltransferase)
MAKIIKMPEIAANATSAVIAQWAKAEGDTIAAGDCLADIETEKAVIEYTAEEAGVLGRILAPKGKDIAVGTPIAILFEAGEQDVDIDALLAQAGGAPAPAAPAAPAHAPTAAPSAADADAGKRVFASPLARRLAQERGLPLGEIAGSGPHGRIVRRDIDAATHAPAPQPAAAPAPGVGDGFVEVPHTSMRRTIARRLAESKATIPHFYLSADCRMDKLLALRAEINANAPRKISVNDFIVKAVAAALQAVPDMNAGWSDTALRKYAHADICVAVSTDGGLITPVVRDAGAKTLSGISAEIADLAARARQGTLAPDEFQGGSFTVSNLGMFGVREFSAIINPPQAAILAVGATLQQPVVVDGQLAVAQVMKVSLSVDHRAVDGALAAQWLAAFQRHIENPLSALI